MGQKCQYLAKNVSFGLNLAVFWPKILILMGVSKSFGAYITGKPPRQLAQIVFWSGIGSNGPKMPIFGQKYEFWAKLKGSAGTLLKKKEAEVKVLSIIFDQKPHHKYISM